MMENIKITDYIYIFIQQGFFVLKTSDLYRYDLELFIMNYY